MLGADGKPLRATDPRVPPGGSIGPGGVILDASGNPVLGADGKPLIAAGGTGGGGAGPQVPPGGSIGPGGIILDANGKPVKERAQRPRAHRLLAFAPSASLLTVSLFTACSFAPVSARRSSAPTGSQCSCKTRGSHPGGPSARVASSSTQVSHYVLPNLVFLPDLLPSFSPCFGRK